MKIFFNQFLMC